jgi:hypothetical protein
LPDLIGQSRKELDSPVKPENDGYVADIFYPIRRLLTFYL